MIRNFQYKGISGQVDIAILLVLVIFVTLFFVYTETESTEVLFKYRHDIE